MYELRVNHLHLEKLLFVKLHEIPLNFYNVTPYSMSDYAMGII